MKRFFEWLKCCVSARADDESVKYQRHQQEYATDNSDAESVPLENAGSGDSCGGGGCGGGSGGGGGGDTRGANISSGVAVGACCGDCDRRLHALERDNERHKSATLTLHDAVAELQSKYLDICRWARGDVIYSPTYVPDDQQQIPVRAEIHESPSQSEPESESPPNDVCSPSTSDQGDSYNMNHQNRGYCHIFSHGVYDSKLGLDARPCAENERNTVSETFRKLGFKVKIHQDYTLDKIHKELTKLSRCDYKKDDCICFFVMTHGNTNGTLYAKDKCYFINIFEKAFDAMKTLKNKPKLLFVQSCRGERADPGIDSPRFSYTSSSSDEIDRTTCMNSTPTKADILIAHSTSEGYVSFRQWFIPALCENLDKYSEIWDLDEILTKTIDIVSTYESDSDISGLNKCKQAPTVIKTLRKKVYFKKKKLEE
ncbi:hypothetical protein QAD02_011525 [Eretmocerus hayati]|uniref:Uncharacterized protein n=1 Tax=Eretmocerus hayati TaxID=131215 RepID=A0ACC2NZM0_9HYME|nr:hypothetical protein QAD02_011525 [Eretmocerus hayati]